MALKYLVNMWASRNKILENYLLRPKKKKQD